MFDRLVNMFKAMFNVALSKAETPEILAEQAHMELQGSMKKVREAVTNSIAREKTLEQQIKQNTTEAETWHKRAALAITQGSEDVARQALQKKQDVTAALENLNAQLEEQKRTTTSLKERFKEMEQKLRDFEVKKKELVSRQQAGKAISDANRLLGTSQGDGTSGLDKWEQKIRQTEAENQAVRELSGEDIKNKVEDLTKHAALDVELEMLKAQVAAAKGDLPKLITTNEKGQPLMIGTDKDKGKKTQAKEEDDAIDVEITEIDNK